MDNIINIKINPRYIKEEIIEGQRLRPFQKETIEAIKNNNSKIIFVEAPVGSGKSYIIRNIIEDNYFSRKPLILTYPTKILMDAQVSAMKKELNNIAIWPDDNFIPKGINIFNYSSDTLIKYLMKNDMDLKLDKSEFLNNIIRNLGFYSDKSAIITSPDVLHILIDLHFYKGSKRLELIIKGSYIFFDEFHLYTNLANFYKLIENLLKNNLPEKLIFLSATPYIKEELKEIQNRYASKIISFNKSIGSKNDFKFNYFLNAEIHQFKYTDLNKTFEKLTNIIPKIEKPVAIIFDSIFRLNHLKNRIINKFKNNFKIFEWSGMKKDKNYILNEKTVILGTSAIEVGIDMNFKTLITEVSYWTSAIQRIGRVGRKSDGKLIIFTNKNFIPYIENKQVFKRNEFENEIIKATLKDPCDKLVSGEMFRGDSFNFALVDSQTGNIISYSESIFAMFEVEDLIDDWKTYSFEKKKNCLLDWQINPEKAKEILLYDKIMPYWGIVKGKLRDRYERISSIYDKNEGELHIIYDNTENGYIFYER